MNPLVFSFFDAYLLKEIKDIHSDVIVVATGGTHIENIAKILYESEKWSNYNNYSIYDYKSTAKNKPGTHLRDFFPLLNLKENPDRNQFALKNIKDLILKMVPNLQKDID